MPSLRKPVSLLQQTINVFAKCLLEYQLFFIGHQLLIPASVAVCPELITTALSTLGPVSMADYLVVLGLFLPMTVRVLDFKGKMDCYAVPLATLSQFGNVETLQLICNCALPEDALINLLPAFGNLKTLILEYPIQDADLIQIGASCKQLQHLEINGNILTDDGISAFCNLMGINNKLKTILIKTDLVNIIQNISVFSAVKILSICPNLKHFEFEFFANPYFQSIVELMTGQEMETHNPYSITEFSTLEVDFNYLNSEANVETLNKFASLFPRVWRVYIQNDDFVLLNCLRKFSHLKELEMLEIATDICQTIFVSVGMRLTRLDLTTCSFDILMLGQRCTNLEYLSLSDCVLSNLNVNKFDDLHFKSLKKLRLCCDFADESDQQLLQTMQAQRYLLKQATNLKNLCLNYKNCLASEFLSREEFKANRMGIEQLYLYQCDSIWPRDIEVLLKSSESQLKKLTVRECRMLTQSDCDFFQNLIHQGNLDVSLEVTGHWAED